jgi:hypothetical protein
MQNNTKCKLYSSGTLATKVLAYIRGFTILYPQKLFVGKHCKLHVTVLYRNEFLYNKTN